MKNILIKNMNQKSLLLLGISLGIFSSTYTTIEIALRSSHMNLRKEDPIAYNVEVRNQGPRRVQVDLLIEWPLDRFVGTYAAHEVGMVTRVYNGMQWHGFTLNPGEEQRLYVKSVMLNDALNDNRSFKVSVKNRRNRVKHELVFAYNNRMGDLLPEEDEDRCCDPIMVRSGGNVNITILGENGSLMREALEVLESPRHGDIIINDNVICYFHNDECPDDSVMDYFSYKVNAPASPAISFIDDIYLYIYNPNSISICINADIHP